ncbi:hypothetical protein [Elizabethkingia anophelis]|uniref:hypothetical protein n=1 Tax=Elizabethkingia anophelis TaxID=1117645 RepID=UPI003891908E
MSNLKKIRVEVTYSVGLGELNVPEKVLDQLLKAYDNNKDLSGDDMLYSSEYSEAAEWLADNIREKDCYNWECEIVELKEATE